MKSRMKDQRHLFKLLVLIKQVLKLLKGNQEELYAQMGYKSQGLSTPWREVVLQSDLPIPYRKQQQ